jgi:hypothetical protein
MESVIYCKDKILNIQNILNILNKEGFCILKNYFNNEELKTFIIEFDKIFQSNKNNIEILNDEDIIGDERIFNAEKYSNYILNNFFNDNNFDAIAGNYTRKKLNKKTLINKFEYEEGKIKNSGAGWHRDAHQRQFKAIMYLTDVTEKNGNFQFIKNSSIKHIDKPGMRKNAYADTRYDDNTIENLINIKKDCKLINIVGEKGTLILADTSYIHRGNIIQEGERKAITQYF